MNRSLPPARPVPARRACPPPAGRGGVLPALLLFLVAAPLAMIAAGCAEGRDGVIVIGSKNFTEQRILGEILAQAIEARTGLTVDRRFDLGGTFVCHRALVAGEIDMYVEYTGTAMGAILEEPFPAGRDAVYELVRDRYARRFNLVWLPPLGFDNSFAIVVRPEDALTHGLARISDLVHVSGTFRAGFGYEFMERADGWRGLTRTYGFDLALPPREMDLGLLYRALDEGEVDVIAGSATDGPIEALGLVVLEDDLSFFPPYDAAPVVRAETLERHPGLRALLGRLSGAISGDRMRRMNHAVDGEGQSIAVTARGFLATPGLQEHNPGD